MFPSIVPGGQVPDQFSIYSFQFLISNCRSASGILVFASLCLLLVGCRDKPLGLVPVQGKVFGYKNQPVEGAVVSFWPEDSKSTRIATARCQKDGSFKLECPKGSYKVTVTPSKGLGKAAVPIPQQEDSAVPSSYRETGKTRLRVDVPDGGTDKLVLKLD